MTRLTGTQTRLYQTALLLGVFTIFYNLAEGIVSIAFGLSDETLTLFGFGVDSFIEVMSGIGIIVMIARIRQNPDSSRSPSEITALRITGWAFYLLAASLALSAVINIVAGHRPETTLPGMLIATLSILVMWWLVWQKRRVGRALDSAPILADANCTLVCIYMSITLLLASGVYELTGFGFVDSIGALALTWFSFKEGREAFEKARGIQCSCEED